VINDINSQQEYFNESWNILFGNPLTVLPIFRIVLPVVIESRHTTTAGLPLRWWRKFPSAISQHDRRQKCGSETKMDQQPIAINYYRSSVTVLQATACF